jgi:DEAD/DEAH box helicase domain-containing protein
MLPAHIAENVKKQVLYYLQSTFSFLDKKVENAFNRFLEDPATGIFKGPWIQLQRPYRPAPDGELLPFDLTVPFHPFLHQYLSWNRLSSKGNKKPKSTIVTTGTGSGKTECFLFPILDHCLREKQKNKKGIKAIILYPMNALAADQEKRFAETVLKDPALKAVGIRVGNYTGRYDPANPGAAATSGYLKMGVEKDGTYHGITNHGVQQDNPPDILLTNYKMLDFLLMRPQDQPLWRFNEPGTLQYLVLDELHTYDGAQGADVACLIRRLKERLQIAKGELCVVGTSATLDDRQSVKVNKTDGSSDAQETGKDRLARFSGTLFEEDVLPDAVIGEDRLEVEEIVHPDLEDIPLPDPKNCIPLEDEDALAYAKHQSVLWGGPQAETAAERDEQDKLDEEWLVALGSWVKKVKLFEVLLDIFRQAELKREDPLLWKDFVDRVSRQELAFNKISKYEDRDVLIASFIAIVGHARVLKSGNVFPLVPTQVQIWIRELRRLGRIISDTPLFAWLDEPVQGKSNLPTFHCSECGESGWIGLRNTSSESKMGAQGVHGFQLKDDPTTIYRSWFDTKGGGNEYIVIISPLNDSELPAKQPPIQTDIDDFQTGTVKAKPGKSYYFCPASLTLREDDGPCPFTGDSERFRVKIDKNTRLNSKGKSVGDPGCPRCQSKTGIFFIGSQSATLSSVAIDEMFGSILNNDPKLLAFTDSVQDASHRAGFFTSRTYHFTFRTAVQHLVDNAGSAGVPLKETGKQLLEYWSQDKPGFPGPGKAMEALMPPDLQQYQPYLEYRNSSKSYVPKSLKDEVETRLTWEATSEFGLMLTHGRTLEHAGSAHVLVGMKNELRKRYSG